MNSQSETILANLTFLISKDVRGQLGIADKIGYSDSYLSEVFRGKKPVAKRFAKAVTDLMDAMGAQSEPIGSVGCAEGTLKCVPNDPKPLGHIPFKGHDRDRSWEMSVPVYAEESLNDAVLKAVDRLLCVAKGGTTAPSSPNESAAEAITAPKNGLEFTGNTTSDGKRP